MTEAHFTTCEEPKMASIDSSIGVDTDYQSVLFIIYICTPLVDEELNCKNRGLYARSLVHNIIAICLRVG